MNYGESIGKIHKTASPYCETLECHKRVLDAQFLLNTVISGVLIGADRHPVTVEAKDGTLVVFTEPPTEDAEEACHLGNKIKHQIEKGVQGYQRGHGLKILPTEIDRFEPVTGSESQE